LVGNEAKAVTIQTYHGLSLRLSGHALTGMEKSEENSMEQQFQNMIQHAIDLLTGKQESLNVDRDEMRDRLLAGYRHILVDEYQDIDELQYQLISALAGRQQDEDSRLTILAVGDDDQNIYQFRGANIGFIRQFEQDYQAKQHYLVENYRSSDHIISAANQLIQANRDRMKKQHPIRINQGRKGLPAGGRWEQLDPVAKGRVQILICQNENHQAQTITQELLRLRQLDNSLDWTQCAVLATEWGLINQIRGGLEEQGIPLSLVLPKQGQPPPFRIRENLDFINAIKQSPKPLCKASDWLAYLEQIETDRLNIWLQQLRQLLHHWMIETDNAETGRQQLLDYLYEALAEQRRDCRIGQGVFLSTIHSVKGMEFTHVFILDGGWSVVAKEEHRRLLYVAMTRAKDTLCLYHRVDLQNPYLKYLNGDFIVRRNSEIEFNISAQLINKQYNILGLKDFDLSFAGSFAAKAHIHAALAQLKVGDKVEITKVNGKVAVQQNNVIIAMFSKNAQDSWATQLENIISASIIAMVTRYKSDSEVEFQSRCKVEQWEVPLVEVVLVNTKN
jgi:ATP-dependent DNA helicase RecQ